MTVTSKTEGNKVTLTVEGRIDTVTSPEFEKAVKEIGSASELVIDFSKVEYISSSGLRVLLGAQKMMNKQGTMTVTHANEAIMDIFEVTGFNEILTIV